ncbi:MAG TPA: hypothetical protein VN999_05885 [Thermoanaerobaculia bacterium]|nr:hypothetical protein [Thermoanaerobaculia bacterium]
MVLGVTGHQRLDDEGAWEWVAEEIGAALSRSPSPLIGLSSLAVGADQLFATLVLARGGELRAVLPFAAYAETFSPGRDLDGYRALLGRATSVEVLRACSGRQESYLAAGQRVVDLSDLVIAVWNGEEAAGLGGTGDIVRYALEGHQELLHVDPVRREVRRLGARHRRP